MIYIYILLYIHMIYMIYIVYMNNIHNIHNPRTIWGLRRGQPSSVPSWVAAWPAYNMQPVPSHSVMQAPFCSSLKARKNWRTVHLTHLFQFLIGTCHQICIFLWIWLNYNDIPEMGYPNHPFVDGIFHYKPSTWGYPHVWKPPNRTYGICHD